MGEMHEGAALGAVVRRARRAAGLSQESLASRAGVSPRSVSDLERGRVTTPRASTIRALEEVLGDDLGIDAVDSDTSGHPSTRQSIGSLLRFERSRRGLTQRALADLAGVAERTVSDIERGVVDGTRPRTAGLLADALGLDRGDRRRFMSAAMARPSRSPIGDAGLVGRQRELDDIWRSLADDRLVTLVGEGGVGKTSLALAISAHVPSRVVRLESATVGSSLEDHLVAAFVPSGPAVAGLAEVVSALEAEPTLVVLDNLEHLGGVRHALDELLASGPGIRVLATSRSPIGAVGESVITVTPLDAADAVSLFLRGAARAGPVETDDGRVAEICEHLGGVPLAIELASGWTAYMSVEEIRRRLSTSAADLHDRQRPDRHRSLTATIEWSLSLLGEGARSLFVDLATHAGGFTIDLVDAVHGVRSATAFLDLVDAQLVRSSAMGGTTVYEMHAFVRETAARQLTTERESEIRGRVVDYVCERARNASRELVGVDQQRWLERLDADASSLEPTVDAMLRGDDARSLDVVADLWRYWQLRGRYAEGSRLLRSAIDRSPDRAASLAWPTAHYGLAVLTYLRGDVDEARRVGLTSLADYRRLGDEHGIGSVCSLMGMIDRYAGNLDAALEWFDTGLADVTDRSMRAKATLMANRAGAVAALGDLDDAIRSGESAAHVFRLQGDERSVADQLGNVAAWRSLRGEFDAASDLLDEAHAIFTQLDEPQGMADSLAGRGWTQLRSGDVDGASSSLAAAHHRYAELDDRWGVALSEIGLAEVRLLLDDPDGALRLIRPALGHAWDLDYWDAIVRGTIVRGHAHVGRGEPGVAQRLARQLVPMMPASNVVETAALAVLAALTLDPPQRHWLLSSALAHARKYGIVVPELERRSIASHRVKPTIDAPDSLIDDVASVVDRG